ncbi:ShlB/FhaC/HecB family hemolysin secretion/activation protein [Thauera sp. 2A1]|uniref:ShlB/FhaC/HecB family hemolysin secretion/activation protein n=1 Tax=Thauera sp. 2A1 TaxID=2570191 RepID=UPI001290C870|nr:ShlB/FhaC/HecB family hemolysin secretion/activation protein [Thauera sp. 2A1]KAI5916451.1 ShlB/FhaC/HecB family hemolysin secretion/activation protein [Thauera sp. 2A1]
MRISKLETTLHALSLISFAITPTIAAAQTSAPGQPGLIQRQFQAPAEPRAQPGQFRVPISPQVVPPNADQVRFTLSHFEIEGMSVYRQDDMRSYFDPSLDREVSLADIYAIAAALTARYRNDGYILSQVLVPAQIVEDGRLKLQAVEGYVARVVLEGDEESRRALVTRYARAIERERPLTSATLERYLLLMNDLPGAFARASLVASKTEPGASDLIVEFSQRRVSGGVSVDNRGSDALGPVRWSADLRLNSVLDLHETTGIKLVSTLNGELDYASIWHEQQIGVEGGKLGIQANAVRSRPAEGASFIPLNLQTRSDSGSITYSYPVVRSRNQNLYVHAGLSSYDGSTELLRFTSSRDRIRALRVGMTYDLADPYQGINILDFEIAQGLRALGASEPHEPDLSRAEGRPDFTKFSLYAARLQSLAPGWSLLAALNAQYAASDLLAPELFSFGGEQFGRGYDPAELVGDHGAAMKLEVRYTNALDNGVGYTGYGFYDAGYVSQRTPAGLDDSSSAASAGIGLRFDLTRNFSGFVEIAKPLTRTVAAEGNRDLRGYVGLSARF